jgi:hypothetical protein
MAPFGEAVEAGSAVLDFYTHAGVAEWKLNVTDVEGMVAVKLLYGNPEVYGEEGESEQQCSAKH